MNRRTLLKSAVAAMFAGSAHASPQAQWQISVSGYASDPRPYRLLWFRSEDLRERDFDQFSDKHVSRAFAEDVVDHDGIYAQSTTSGGVWCAILMHDEYQWMTDPAAVAPESGSIGLRVS